MPPPPRRGPGVLRASVRALRIAIGCLAAFVVYLRERWRLRGTGPEGRQRAAGRALRHLATDLGATFIKIGQIASSRADLLPPALLEELATLQDRVPPFAYDEVRRTIEEDLGRSLEAVYERFDTEPVAAGSVAQVHRAMLRSTGDDVAVKVLRPDVAARIHLDRSILLFAARFAERVSESARLVSVAEAAGEFAKGVESQLDFVREAASCERMRSIFADDADVIIPRTFPEASGHKVLTLEWVDSVGESDLAASALERRAMMRAGLRLIFRSILLHGFAHADLHPGNVRFRPPRRIVLLDYGLMAELRESDRVALGPALASIVSGDGRDLAKFFYDHSPRRQVASYAAYEADMKAAIGDVQRRTVSETDYAKLIGSFLRTLRKHRIQASSHLTLIYLGGVSAEGLGKRLQPDLMFFDEIYPYIAESVGLLPAPAHARGANGEATATETLPAFASGRYRLVRLAGEGARKRVYLARDTNLERDVAIGFLKTEKLDSASLARLQLEARAMAKLGDHPGIVAVHDFDTEEGRPYLVSEYMAGGTLAELLEAREGKPLGVGEAIEIATQVCRALEHAHGHGVIHRDLKPANVWLTRRGAAKLGDFGLSTASELLRPGEKRPLVGTIAYMSPEQALGKHVTARSDLYSLGCVLYEMLTGEAPFPGGIPAEVLAAHLGATPPSLAVKNPEVPPELERLVSSCLAKNPNERPESAGVLAEALSAIVLREGGSPTSPLERLESDTFVGRDQEMATLLEAADEMFAGKGKLFLLAGEPGIGKTRMAEQLALHVRRHGARVVFGRCYEGEGAPAFWPWLQIIRDYARDREPTALEAELGVTGSEVAQLVPELRERLPHIPVIVAQEGEVARFRLFDAIARLLKNAAAATPLVLVLDDIHWADGPSLQLLQFLASEIESSRILVAATYRDVEVQHGHPLAEALPAIRRSRAYGRIRVRGLVEDDVVALCTALCGREIDAGLARTIHRETEGNPFFVKEIVSHLFEEDALRREGERWVADRRLGEIGLPESVREVIGRRAARLSARCRRVLTLAAVAGREFDVAVLAEMVDLDPRDLDEALAEACASRVIAEMPKAIGRFRFAHALIRETLYGELRTAERIALHRRIGDTLERVHAGHLEEHLAEIAYHFAETAPGGDVEKAVDYAARAGDAASAQLAFEEAARCYAQALECLDLGRAHDPMRRCALLLKLGEARLGAGDIDASKEFFLRSAEIAEAQGAADELATAALGYGGQTMWNFFLTQPADRLVFLGLLEKALAALGDGDSGLRAQAMARLALTLTDLEDRPRRLALAREGLQMARRVGDKIALGRVLITAALAEWTPDMVEERLRTLEDAVAFSRGLSDPALGFLLEVWRGLAQIEAGDWDRGGRLIDSLVQRPEASRGAPGFVTTFLRGAKATFEGRFEDGEGFIRDVQKLGDSVRWPDLIVVAGAQITVLRWLQGRIDDAFVQWLALGREFRDWPVSRYLTLFAKAAARSPDTRAEIEAVAQQSFEDVPRDLYWFTHMFTVTEAVCEVGDVVRARRLFELLSPYAKGGTHCFALWFGSTSRQVGKLATLLGRYDAAAGYFEEAIAANERGRGRPWVALARFDYARMLSLRCAPGDHEKALRLVAQAIEAAEAIGMQRLLADALALKLELEGVASADVKGSIDVVAQSIDRRRPDLSAHAAPDGTVTLLFGDIDGFAAITERLGDRGALELAAAHNAIVGAEVRAHGGFEVELQGDGFLLSFSSAFAAGRCAIAIQRALSNHPQGHGEEVIRSRIGIHTGEVIKEGDRFFGRTVVLGARIAARARGGQILASSVVRGLLADRDELHFGREREIALEGLAGRHLVSPLLWNGELDEPAEVPLPAAAANVFRKDGDFWTLDYDGKTFSMRDAKGLHYISHLLRHPRQEFHSLDLARVVSNPGGAEEAAMPRIGDAGEILDPQARTAYKARVEDLRSELEEARERNDVGRSEKLEEEIDFLTQELSAAFGLGGRQRRSTDPAERARKAVCSRISDSIARIGKEHPALALHLSNNLRLGVFCAYLGERIDWGS